MIDDANNPWRADNTFKAATFPRSLFRDNFRIADDDGVW